MADGEVGAMGNVQPGGVGRRNIINALFLNKMVRNRGGSGGGGGGGMSKKDWKNKSDYLKHQYTLQDELEQAQAARGVETTANNRRNMFDDSAAMVNAGNGGGPQSFQTDVHNPGGVRQYLSPAELLLQDQNGNKFHSKGSGPAGDAPVEDTPVKDTTPVKSPPKKLKSEDLRLRLNNMVDATGSEQGTKTDQEWDDYLGAASALANSHDIQARDETRKRNNSSRSKSPSRGWTGTSGPAPYKPEVIEGGRVSFNSSAADRADTAAGLSATEHITGITANDKGAPIMGVMGNRPALSGESGIEQSKQF